MNQNQKIDWINKRKAQKAKLNVDSLFDKLILKDKGALSSAITLLESSLLEDQNKAKLLINKCLPFTGNSLRIGITGVPGVGKSTFIEAFGTLLLKKGKRIAVLAIDPSSAEGGGSILGDKTRMNQLSTNENAFIRPSPSGASLGGVARKTRESILLCEAAGFDIILVETVGVGQSETMVHSMVDFFLLLMLAGAGDELQGIKRGIMELADLLVVNKADGDNITKANLAAREYKNALHLFPPKKNGWTAKSMTCSALNFENMEAVWREIDGFFTQTEQNGSLENKRENQDAKWFRETLSETVLDYFANSKSMKTNLNQMEEKVLKKMISPFEAAEELFENWLKSN